LFFSEIPVLIFKMKKSFYNHTSTNDNLNPNINSINKKLKTTDINILLNRVKVDKKNDLKKKIIFLSILIFAISIVTGFALF
jgi:hypothetical protein